MEGITTLFFIVKILLLLPLLLGFSVPAIAHNEANGGDAMHSDSELTPLPITPITGGGYVGDEEGEGAEDEDEKCVGLFCE